MIFLDSSRIKIISIIFCATVLFFGAGNKVLALVDVAPHNMTSNVLPVPYVASGVNTYNSTYDSWHAFDGVIDTSGRWLTSSATAQLELDLGVGNGTVVGSYAIVGPDPTRVLTQAPATWTFEGSNDNNAWSTLDTVTGQSGWTGFEVRTFTCDVVSASYRYFRLNITANVSGGSNTTVVELYLYQLPAATAYTMTGFAGGTNGEASRNFTVAPNGLFTGTITPSDAGGGGTFSPTSLTWSGSADAKTFTYTPVSTGAKTISATSGGALTNPSSLTYFSTAYYAIQPGDLWDNAYSTDETNYYLSSPFTRLVANTDATGLAIKVWENGGLMAKVAVIVDGTPTLLLPTIANGENVFYVNGLSAGQKTVEIVSGMQQIVGTRHGTFLKSVEWFGANTTITPPVANKRIVIYGDSTLAGYATINPPIQAPGILVRNYYVDRSVLEETWASRALKDDSSVGPPAVNQSLIDSLTLGNPTHIWLGIGVNDYGHSAWSASDFGLAYANLLDRLHSAVPNTVIIAETPITQGTETANSFGNTLGDYRTQIATLAGTRSWVTLVLGPSLLTYPTDYDGDQHPNTAGSAKYATAMEPYFALSTDATLSNLTVNSGTLSPSFSSGHTVYTDSVSYATTSVFVTPTVNQANATVKVNNITVTSGQASGAISLNVGSNTANVVVTAQDRTTTATYTITVTRAANPVKSITAFRFPQGEGVISGTDISVIVPFGTYVTGLIPSITISGSSISPASGVPEDFTNSQTYIVTAADNTTQNYTVTVTIASRVVTQAAGGGGGLALLNLSNQTQKAAVIAQIKQQLISLIMQLVQLLTAQLNQLQK